MNNVQKIASLHEKTVQKVASDNLKKRARSNSKRKSNSRVQVRTWCDGVDARIVEKVLSMGVDLTCVEVRGPYEVVIHNNPRK